MASDHGGIQRNSMAWAKQHGPLGPYTLNVTVARLV